MDALRDAEAFSEIEGARLSPFLNADMGMRQSRIPNHGVVASIIRPGRLEKTMAYSQPAVASLRIRLLGKNRATLTPRSRGRGASGGDHESAAAADTAVARVYSHRALARPRPETASEMVKLRKGPARARANAVQNGIDTADGVTAA